jgi:hypothetical protein
MTQQVKEKLVNIKFVEKEQKILNKQLKREKAQAKIENFLIRLNKEHKPVKRNLRRLSNKIELNAKYLEHKDLIQEMRYQQFYRNYGIY